MSAITNSTSTESSHIKTIARSSLVNTISTLVSMIVSIITLPLILKSVGDEAYGFLVVITSLIGILGFGELGLTNTLRNAIVRARIEQRSEQIVKLMNGVVIFFIAFFGIVITLFVLIGKDVLPITTLFQIDEHFIALLMPLLIIVGITWIINTLLAGVIKAAYSGFNQLEYYNRVQIFYTITFGITYILFLLTSPTLIGIAIFLLVFACVRFLFLGYYAKRFLPKLRLQIGIQSVITIKELLRYSPVFIFLGISASLLAKGDTLMLSHAFGLAAVTQYAIARKLFNLPSNALKLTETSFPSIAELVEQKKFETLRSMHARLVRLNIVLRISIILPILLYSKELVSLWVGQGMFAGYPVMVGLFVMYIVYSWTAPHVQMSHGLFYYQAAVLPSLLYLAGTLLSYDILVPIIGITAVPVAFAIGNLLGNGVLLPWILKKRIAIKPLKPLGTAFLRMTLPTIVMIIIWYIHTTALSGMAWTIIIGILNTLLFLFLIFRFGLSRDERGFILRKTKRIFSQP